MNSDKNISVEKCPKCSQQTFVETTKKYAIEKWCDNCGYFTPKYFNCCNDPYPKKVIYTNKDSSMAIRLQCFNCGGKIGVSPVAKFKDADSNKLPFFNEASEFERLDELTKIKQYYNALIKTNKWRLTSNYLKYLASDRWATLRLKILKRDKFKCKCGADATQVHHLTYDRIENELDEDLISICRTCHLKEHGLNNNI